MEMKFNAHGVASVVISETFSTHHLMYIFICRCLRPMCCRECYGYWLRFPRSLHHQSYQNTGYCINMKTLSFQYRDSHHNIYYLIFIMGIPYLKTPSLYPSLYWDGAQGAVSIRKTVLPGMAIPMLKIRRPNGRLIFNMEIAIRR